VTNHIQFYFTVLYCIQIFI